MSNSLQAVSTTTNRDNPSRTAPTRNSHRRRVNPDWEMQPTMRDCSQKCRLNASSLTGNSNSRCPDCHRQLPGVLPVRAPLMRGVRPVNSALPAESPEFRRHFLTARAGQASNTPGSKQFPASLQNAGFPPVTRRNRQTGWPGIQTRCRMTVRESAAGTAAQSDRPPPYGGRPPGNRPAACFSTAKPEPDL